MAMQVASLFGVLSLDDSQFRRNLDNARTGMRGLADGLQGIGGRMQSVGAQMTMITAPLAIGMGQGIRVASDFDGAMRMISARTGIVGEELEQISDFALQMGADTIYSGQQAAEAFLQLLSSGQSAAEAIATLPTVLNLAAASGNDLGQTADVVTDIMAAFGLGVDDAAAVADSLARAAASSSADVASLGQGFANVGGVARQFGLSVDDTAAALAIFSENGIKGAEGGTQLRSMLLNMGRTTEGVQNAWAELGTSLYDANGNIRPLNAVISDLDYALDKLPLEEQNRLMMELGGSYGIMGLTALRSSMSIEQMQETMQGQADAATIAGSMMDGFGVTVDSLLGSVETLMIQGLTPLMNDVLQPMVADLIGVVNGITDWVDANPELASQIALLMGGLVVAGPIIAGVGTAISVVGGIIAAITSPIGLVVAGIAALALAFATDFGGIRTAVEPIVNWFTGEALPAIANFITGTVIPKIQEFAGVLGGIWEDVSPFLQQLADWFTLTALPMVVNFIETTVMPIVNTFRDTLGAIWETISPAFGQMYDWFITTGLPAITSFIEGPVTQVIDSFFNLLSGFWAIVQPIWTAFRDGVIGILQWVIDNALQPFMNLLNDLLGVIGDVLAGIADFMNRAAIGAEATGGILSGLASGEFTLEQVFNAARGEFGFAAGGYTGDAPSGSVAGVVHAREYVVPEGGALVMRGGGPSVEIGSLTINANDAAGGRAAADAFSQRLQDLMRANG